MTSCHFCNKPLPSPKRGAAPRLAICAKCDCGVYAFQVDGLIHYVGASYQIAKRWTQHRSDATRTAKADFVRAAGPAALVLLEQCDESALADREQHWIEVLHLSGHPLTFQGSHKASRIAIGDTFGAWTVIGGGEGRTQAERRWLCRCVCGKERTVREATLLNRRSRSCSARRDNPCKRRIAC